MKTNELRIGNWVLLNGKPLLVQSIDDTCINVGFDAGYYQDLEGIPLTPEIFERAGFEKHEINGIRLRAFEGYVSIRWMFNTTSPRASEGRPLVLEIDDCRMPLYNVLYVHQLQNLVHALTGEELTL